MTTIDELMALADEYTRICTFMQDGTAAESAKKAREALRTAVTEALAQQSQTTGCTSNCDNCIYAHGSPAHAGYCYAFYKEPQGVCAQWKDASLTNDGTKAQPVREPLTDDQIQEIYIHTYNIGHHGRDFENAFARAIERAHNIRGEN